MLTTPKHLPVLNKLGNGFQDEFLHHPSWDQVEGDKPEAPQFFLLAFLENGSGVCFLPALTNVL